MKFKIPLTALSLLLALHAAAESRGDFTQASERLAVRKAISTNHRSVKSSLSHAGSAPHLQQVRPERPFSIPGKI